MNIPGPEGCRTNMMSISITTIKGNSNTTPSGMEIFELPFNRIRRRKKANLGESFCCCFASISAPGILSRLLADGSRKVRPEKYPIFWVSGMEGYDSAGGVLGW